MKSVTSAYKTAVKDYGRTFQNELIVTDGTNTETYTSAEISIEECFSQEDALSMGGFFTKEAKIKIYEPLGNVAYKNCSYTINSKLLVGNSYESVAMGVFYPSEVKVNDGSIEITAYDLMASLTESYEPSSSVATDTAILSDICTQKGITLASGTSGLNQAVTLVEGTIQEQLGWLAGLQGKNAIINEENKLEFRWYSKTSQGGTTWQDIVVAWQDMNGTWANQNLDAYPIGRDAQVENGCSLDEGSFTIASLTSGTADTPIVVGSGKGLSFENPYMTQARLNAIWNGLGNKTYYTGSVKTFGYPCLEVGDIVLVVDKNGVQHDFYLSKNSWEFKGGCNCTINSVGNPDAEIEFSTESPTEKKISGVKTLIQSVKATLSNLINTTEGIFSIRVTNGQTTGWDIVDNPTNPQKIVRATLGGIGFSSDGGQNFENAITGEGIVATAITTGTMSADRIQGGTLSLGGYNDAYGKMQVKDATNVEIVSIDKRGIIIKDNTATLENPAFAVQSGDNASVVSSTEIVMLDGNATNLPFAVAIDSNDHTGLLELNGSMYVNGTMKIDGYKVKRFGCSYFKRSTWNYVLYNDGTFEAWKDKSTATTAIDTQTTGVTGYHSRTYTITLTGADYTIEQVIPYCYTVDVTEPVDLRAYAVNGDMFSAYFWSNKEKASTTWTYSYLVKGTWG